MRNENDTRNALQKALETRGEQGKIAKCLDVHTSTVKRWAEGEIIPPAMQKLLAWYLFGEAPPSLVKSCNLQDSLVFDDVEWRIISHLARREGITEAQWITGRIRSYLAYIEEPKESLRVASNETPYKVKRK